MALLKAHYFAGVSLTAKNHYGSIDAREHWYIQSRTTGMGSYSPLVDLIGHQHLGGKTLLFMIDGLYGARDFAATPNRWPLLFSDSWPASLLLSQDPVAIDSVAADFLIAEFGKVAGTSEYLPNCDNYLHEAALADDPPSGSVYAPNGDGLRLGSPGVHEHWNNATSKQYSRNLGSGYGIELFAATATNTPVVLTQPSEGAAFYEGADIRLQAAVLGDGGPYTSLAFVANQTKLGEAKNSPYSLLWSHPPAREYRVKVQASAASGVVVHSPSVSVKVGTESLIARRSGWKYSDAGIDFGAAWRQTEYDDSAWSGGPGRFHCDLRDYCYPDCDAAELNCTPITTYFRHRFVLDDPSRVATLTASLLRFAGAVVYLNNSEVFRSNMLTNDINFDTSAVSYNAPGLENMITTAISRDSLVPGTNVVAVEIHRHIGYTRKDFDFELSATFVPAVPLSCQQSGACLVLSWPASARSCTLQAAVSLTPSVLWTAVTNAPVLSNEINIVITDLMGQRFFRLVRP